MNNRSTNHFARHRRHKLPIRKVARTAIDFANQPLPKSLEWVYGFAFKVGIFLILKSFLALRFLHLSFSGILIVFSQLIMAFAFIIFGLIMQRPGSLFDRPSLRLSKFGFAAVGIYSAVICIAKAKLDMDFFTKAASKNWFVDFFNSIFKGIGEIGLSIVFWDIDLWTIFCFVLLALTIVSEYIASSGSDSSPKESASGDASQVA